MKHPYLIDLNNEENWLNPQVLRRPDGTPGEDQRTINIGEGVHRLFCVTDSIMYPSDLKNSVTHFHEHTEGYEYFFIDSGGMDLYVDCKKTYVAPGSIVFFQPLQAHGMSFRAPTKYRGVFHDMKNSDTANERAILRKNRPEVVNAPDYFKRFVANQHDTVMREPFPCEEVPVEQVSAVRHIDRPLIQFKLDGVTMKMITARWENGGVNEMWAAEMEPGFRAEWVEYPAENEMYYITEGEIEFKVYDEVFTAYPECFVKIPLYASHRIRAVKKSVMYDIGGLTRWQALLQDRSGILNDPKRAKAPEVMDELKAKYGCQIKSCGLS
jgi:mannose-6-phosphate isomerase-like protein (cupin superfamily)